MWTVKTYLAIGLLLSFFSVSAQTETDSVKRMDDVVVTATRKNTAIAVLPYTVNILDRNAIQKQLSRTVPESLDGIPGLFIQKTNHGGGLFAWPYRQSILDFGGWYSS